MVEMEALFQVMSFQSLVPKEQNKNHPDSVFMESKDSIPNLGLRCGVQIFGGVFERLRLAWDS